MIISHSRKFIFLKTYLTDGDAIERYLNQFLDINVDIATNVRYVMGQQSKFYHTPMNYAMFNDYIHASIPKTVYSISDIYERVPEARDYPVFYIDRNPWTKLRLYIKGTRRFNTINRNILSGLNKTLFYNWQYYTINNKPVGDAIYYEKFDPGFRLLCDHAGIPHISMSDLDCLEHEEPSDLASFYTPVTRSMVLKHFTDEINYHGYTFPGDL